MTTPADQRSRIRTSLCDRLGARVPIFGFTHSLDAAIAVTRAGGVGDVLGQVERHRVEALMHAPVGQSVAFFDRLTTVADVMTHLEVDAVVALEGLTAGGASRL